MNKKYGWRRDIPDQRDYQYRPIIIPELPSKIDLRKDDSLIYDQGNLGSCTAQASAGCLEFNNLSYTPSRLYIYYNTRVIEHTISWDSGASIRNTIKAIARDGYCRERIWPYHIDNFVRRPNRDCYQEARENKIIYSRIYGNHVNSMKTTIYNGVPFIFGFSVYESFESDETAVDGIVKMPNRHEKLLGGHAVMGIGYDDETQRFILRNSWGNTWGDDGYFYMPYEYIKDQNLAGDFWILDVLR